MNLGALWDQLVDAVCRPPRDDAYTENDLVGGRRASFRLYDRKYYRQDLQLTNARGQKLQASHYRPCVITSKDGRLPVVVYCHCNSGSRRDAEEILYHLLPKGITVFALDFSGSGLSEGGYVTLGAHETDDLAAVVAYLREEGSSSTIGLWGRSMGSVTALLYSQKDPSIAGMVLDSPFSRLVDLMLELATGQELRIPKPLIKVALAMLKRSVKKRAGFSVDKVAPLDSVGKSHIPALFAHGKDDTFVHPHHSERLHQAYACPDKELVVFDGEHNSVRPEDFYDRGVMFLFQALHVEDLVGPGLDLAAAPTDALPHLAHRPNSIYVTASHGADGKEEREGEGSQPGSLSGRSNSMTRRLNVPWTLPGLHGLPVSERMLSALQSGGGGGGEGQQAGDAADAGLSEEEALQLALALSIQDAQQQAAEAAGEADAAGAAANGGAQQAAAALAAAEQQQQEGGAEQPMHVRYNAAFASSGAEGRRNPLFGGSSATGDVPLNAAEEEAMLAAALAASLQDQQQGTDGAGGAAAGAAGAAAEPAAPAAAAQRGTSEAMEQYYGRAGPAGALAGFGEGEVAPQATPLAVPPAAPAEAVEQAIEAAKQAMPELTPEVARERTASDAAQAVADAHAGQEAAAARQPSRDLARGLGAAAGAGDQLSGETDDRFSLE